MKKLLAVLLSVCLLLGVTACAENTVGENDTEEISTYDNHNYMLDLESRVQIDIYTFTEETIQILNFVLDREYPDFFDRFYINYVLEGEDYVYIDKVENALDSRFKPHIYIADARYAKRFAANAQTASLSELGIHYTANELYQYTIDLMTINGEVKGITHQATPGAVFYRSDIAQHIGYNDYHAVQAKLNTWDGFVDMARDLKAEGVYMVYGLDEIARPFLNSRSFGWVNEYNELTIDEAMIKEFLNVSTRLYEIGAYASYNSSGQWSDYWWVGMRGGEIYNYNIGVFQYADVFAYFGCTWFLHYVLKPSTFIGGHDEYERLISEGKTDADLVGDGTFGNWGVVAPPDGYGYHWGHTYWFASKAAAEDKEVSEGVRMIFDTLINNSEVMKAYCSATDNNYYYLTNPEFSNIKSVNEELSKDSRFNDPFLGGQNHYEIFTKAANTIDSTNATIYDYDFERFFNDAIYTYFLAIDLGASPDQAYDTAMAMFVERTKTNIPFVIIPAEYSKFALGAIEISDDDYYNYYL
ncbi:MAG: hypothetical protein FWD34_08855 [Oscillospiraceae bacterium]|nr:hypothetical protein [Oscillospiraceae bacterium]